MDYKKIFTVTSQIEYNPEKQGWEVSTINLKPDGTENKLTMMFVFPTEEIAREAAEEWVRRANATSKQLLTAFYYSLPPILVTTGTKQDKKTKHWIPTCSYSFLGKMIHETGKMTFIDQDVALAAANDMAEGIRRGIEQSGKDFFGGLGVDIG